MNTTDVIRDLYALREFCAENTDAASYLSTIISWLEQETDFSEEFKNSPVRVGNCTFELDFQDPFFRQFYFGYRHEKTDLDLCLAICPPGGIVWDVGASAGLYAVQIAKRDRPPSHVMAIEPGRRALALLKRNVQINGVENIVRVFDCALGEENREAEFFEAQTSAMSGLSDTGRSPIERVYPIAVRTADEMWEEEGRPPVNLMKIDVEGHEGEVLAGAQRLLAGSPDIIVMFEVSFKNLPPIRRSALSEKLGQLAADGWNFHLHSGGNGTGRLTDFGGSLYSAIGNVYMVRAGSTAETALHGFVESMGVNEQDMPLLRRAIPAALAQIKLYTEHRNLEPQKKINELAAQIDKLHRRRTALENQLQTVRATLQATEAIAHAELAEKQMVAQKLIQRSEELTKSLKKCAELEAELEKYRS